MGAIDDENLPCDKLVRHLYYLDRCNFDRAFIVIIKFEDALVLAFAIGKR